MRYGLNLPPFGDFANPHTLANLAADAEHAGWDGFFIWDHIVFDPSWHAMLDPWVGLAVVALRTQTIRIGTMLTPLPRRRPWKVAREAVTLDLLSNGRLTLGVGIGDPIKWEFGFFGEPTDAVWRAEMLDESLQILIGLWSGEYFSFHGKHYQLQEMIFRPKPVQQPRIPIWVGGYWPRKPPMRRAAQWDGAIPGKTSGSLTPDDWRDLLAYISVHRTATTPFDAVVSGETSGVDREADRAKVAEFAAVGCNWWLEDISPWRFGADWEAQWSVTDTERMRTRVRQGPPH